MSWVEFYILKKRNAYFPGCLYTDFTVYRYIYIYIIYIQVYICFNNKKTKTNKKKEGKLNITRKKICFATYYRSFSIFIAHREKERESERENYKQFAGRGKQFILMYLDVDEKCHLSFLCAAGCIFIKHENRKWTCVIIFSERLDMAQCHDLDLAFLQKQNKNIK